jgi:hypothetical protein
MVEDQSLSHKYASLKDWATSELKNSSLMHPAICGLQRINGNILMRFEPTNFRIVYLKSYLRKLKYVFLSSWVRQ